MQTFQQVVDLIGGEPSRAQQLTGQLARVVQTRSSRPATSGSGVLPESKTAQTGKYAAAGWRVS